MASLQPASETSVEGPAFAESAGIVEGDIEPAVGLDRQRHQRLGIVLRAHVAGERHRAAAAALDLGDQARQFGFAPCADHDLGAFGREQLGGGPADAGAGAGDDGDLVVKTSLCVACAMSVVLVVSAASHRGRDADVR